MRTSTLFGAKNWDFSKFGLSARTRKMNQFCVDVLWTALNLL